MRYRIAGPVPVRRGKFDGCRRRRPIVARHARPYTGYMLEFEISAAETAELVKKNQVRLLDVREPWEYATARIGGSVLMPMGDVPSRAHQELDPDERVVVLCHHGMRSLNVTVWLRNQGFEQVQSLRGGIDAWAAEVDSSVSRY
jgi:rhodanese-related sulfurtransferase